MFVEPNKTIMSVSAKKAVGRRVTKYTRRPYEAMHGANEIAQEMSEFLAGHHSWQKKGLSPAFDWQWFITMTSKDTMTLNGARLAAARYIGLLSQEISKGDFTVFWVAEPHNLGKDGYHLHMLIAGLWPAPKHRPWLNAALLLDDVYQRSMGLYYDNHSGQYRNRFGRVSEKHRFRAVPYTPQFAMYCAKYLTKGSALWEFARITSSDSDVIAQSVVEGATEGSVSRDRKGNWNKSEARRQTRQIKRDRRLREAEAITTIKHLLEENQRSLYKYARIRGLIQKDGVDVEWFIPDGKTTVL